MSCSKLLIFLFLTTFAWSQETEPNFEWRGDEVPDPRVDFDKCNGEKASRVCDPDKLWTSKDEISYLRSALLEIERNITAIEEIEYASFGKYLCPNNTDHIVRFYVIRVADIFEKEELADLENDVIRFTNNVIKTWKLDEVDCRNYILITVINAHSALYIAQGEHVPKVGATTAFSAEFDPLSTRGPDQKVIDLFNKESYSLGVLDIAGHALEFAKKAKPQSNNIQSAGILGTPSNNWWRRLLIMAVVTAVVIVLVALFGWAMYTSYTKKTKTGSWSRPIPLHVKRLNDPSAIYPEYVGTMASSKLGTATMRTTRSTSTDMYGIVDSPSMSPSPMNNRMYANGGIPPSRMPRQESESPSPQPTFGQQRSQPTAMTPPLGDDDSLDNSFRIRSSIDKRHRNQNHRENEEGYAQPETDMSDGQPRVAHMVQHHYH